MKKTKNGKTFFLEGEIIIFSSINLFENNYIRFSYIILFVITRAGPGFIYFFRERKTYFENTKFLAGDGSADSHLRRKSNFF